MLSDRTKNIIILASAFVFIGLLITVIVLSTKGSGTSNDSILGIWKIKPEETNDPMAPKQIELKSNTEDICLNSEDKTNCNNGVYCEFTNEENKTEKLIFIKKDKNSYIMRIPSLPGGQTDEIAKLLLPTGILELKGKNLIFSISIGRNSIIYTFTR